MYDEKLKNVIKIKLLHWFISKNKNDNKYRPYCLKCACCFVSLVYRHIDKTIELLNLIRA